jgi:hypothetical protein
VSLERKGASLTCNEQEARCQQFVLQAPALRCTALHCCPRVQQAGGAALRVGVSQRGTCLGLVESGRCCKKLERIDQQRGRGQSWAAADEERGPDCMGCRKRPWPEQCGWVVQREALVEAMPAAGGSGSGRAGEGREGSSETRLSLRLVLIRRSGAKLATCRPP